METTFWQDVNQFLHIRQDRPRHDRRRTICVWLTILTIVWPLVALFGGIFLVVTFGPWLLLFFPVAVYLEVKLCKFLDFYDKKYHLGVW